MRSNRSALAAANTTADMVGAVDALVVVFVVVVEMDASKNCTLAVMASAWLPAGESTWKTCQSGDE